MNDWINVRFNTHPVGKNQTLDMAAIRDRARDMADQISASCPDGREKSLALTKLEESMFWANAGIARDGV